ncbi:glycosyl transferase family 17 [Candidatus Pelagibacter sp.]|nr:glycosyl transferase family 17 [Candidatus Pelagibacter sp.]
MKSKIYDCITFFDNNFIFNLRYSILKDFVDYFIVCESKFDHKGKPKKINFIKNENYEKKNIRHIVLEKPFPKNNDAWENQAIQREFLLSNLSDINDDDYIFFSDPDEIQTPEILINFELKKKYGIFMQKTFNYKFNLFNKYESPWEGTRVCKKKNLKSINFMRQKVKSKNLTHSFFRIDKEKNIEIFNNGGWHFNNMLSPEEISLKLKTFAHTEFSSEEFSSIKIIEEKIEKRIDLFNRHHTYKAVEIDDTFPKYLLENLNKYEKFIIKKIIDYKD